MTSLFHLSLTPSSLFFLSSLLLRLFYFFYFQAVDDKQRELNTAMKLMNKEKKDMDKIMEDMNSDAVLDLLRSETGEDKEMVQAKRDLKVLDMFIKADVSARGSEALMDGSSKKSRSNMLREMILFMQQVLTAVKLGEGGMAYQIATDLSALSIYTTQAISVMAESPDKSTKRKIVLSSSHLPKDKTSKSSADGFAEVFKFH